MNKKHDIGILLRTIRKQKGLTQIEVAKAAGIAVNSLRLYESNKRQPRFEQLLSILGVLEISLEDLIKLKPTIDTIENREELNAAITSLFELGDFYRYKLQRKQLLQPLKDQYTQKISIALESISNAVFPKDDIDTIIDSVIDSTFDYALKTYKIDLSDEYLISLLELYHSLNAIGQLEAVERVEELTQIPKYQLTETENNTSTTPDTNE